MHLISQGLLIHEFLIRGPVELALVCHVNPNADGTQLS